MTQYVNAEGVPLRGDGTPFPSDPSLWRDDERAYLEQHWFTAWTETEAGPEQVATVDHVPGEDEVSP
jgi:hypothetical protein